MITDMQVKPLTKDSVFREGRLYCRLWDTEISVMLFDEDVTLEYAEKCAQAVNSMPPELIHAICLAAKKYCLTFFDEINDEWKEELMAQVPVDEHTDPSDMMKYFCPTGMVVESPKDPSRIGYQLECSCGWEEEHGMEIDILDNTLVYLSSFDGNSPWDDHSDEFWNYALEDNSQE